MNIIEKEGCEGFMGKHKKNTVVDHHLPPRTERDNSTICPTNYAPTSKELHVSAQVYGVRLLRLGRCNIKMLREPLEWAGWSDWQSHRLAGLVSQMTNSISTCQVTPCSLLVCYNKPKIYEVLRTRGVALQIRTLLHMGDYLFPRFGLGQYIKGSMY
jgi:hypothetical protein